MDIYSSIIYGTIQGITEFLPVSSSGHLALLPTFLKIEDPGLIFDLTMHVGTALAVLCYFYRDVITLLHELLALVIPSMKGSNKRYFVINLIISTITTAIFGYVLKNWSEDYGRNNLFIGANLVIFGLLMLLADRKKTNQSNLPIMENSSRPKMAFWIGVWQTLAVFPGVSRSGVTLTISRFMGLSRNEAARYSFLMSLPVIFGAFILKFSDFYKDSNSFDLTSCLVGGVTSFVVGIFTIHFFIKLLEKIGLIYFSIYRFILALLLWWYLVL